jgi:hypothetical protein
VTISTNLFESEIERSIEYCGLFGFKLATPRSMYGLFLSKVPYDFHIFGENGSHAALEAKQNLSGFYLAFSRVAPHQEEALLRVASLGGNAYIIMRCLGDEKADPVVYAVPIHRWLEEKRRFCESGHRGVRVDTISGIIQVPMADFCSGYLWDLRVLLCRTKRSRS